MFISATQCYTFKTYYQFSCGKITPKDPNTH